MRTLVTGANRGIGLEYVRQLAGRGDRVFAACRRPEEASALQELRGKHPKHVSIFALDVADPESLAASRAAVSAQTDALDLLINNAAIAPDDGGLGGFDLATMQRTLLVNAIAPLLVAEVYLDLLRAGDQPKIINISSGAGSLASRQSVGPYSYCASKAALNMHTRNLAHDLQEDGIIVLALDPGWVKTDMGGPQAMIEPRESVRGMLNVIDSLTLQDSGEFYRYNGEQVPW